MRIKERYDNIVLCVDKGGSLLPRGRMNLTMFFQFPLEDNDRMSAEGLRKDKTHPLLYESHGGRNEAISIRYNSRAETILW
jgi:hypothetical protein